MNPAENSRFDVVIIGAGPAGTMCAALLARRGVHVLLCDKATFPREKICGDCVNPGCWDFFRMLGVESDIAANAEVITGIQIAGRSGKILEVPFESRSTKQCAPFVGVKRSTLDSILLQRAIREGATFCEATSIGSCSFEPSDKGHWKVCLRSHETGTTTNIVCATLIGADGRNSRVAKLLAGIGDEQVRVKENNSDRIGIQFTVKRNGTVGQNVLMFFFEGGYGGIVGVTASEANVAMVVTRRIARLAATNFENFIAMTIHENQSARRIIPKVEMTGEIHTAFPIVPQAVAQHYSSVYFIGDARRTTEPFTGEGVLFALQDGLRAAQSILKSLGIPDETIPPPLRNRFVRDNIVSPALQRESISHILLALGLRYKVLAQLAGKMVFR